MENLVAKMLLEEEYVELSPVDAEACATCAWLIRGADECVTAGAEEELVMWVGELALHARTFHVMASIN